MLLLLYFCWFNVAMPQIVAYAQYILEPIMVIVITLSGILMLFGAVGIKISNNLGSIVVGGIFRGIGYLCRTLFQAIGWVIRNTFRIIPRVLNGSRRIFKLMGLNEVPSNICSVIVVIIMII